LVYAKDSKQSTTQVEEVVGKPAKSSLLGIERELKSIILSKFPDAKVDNRGHLLIISYRSNSYKFHITDERGNLSDKPAKYFPPDFSELLLYISFDEDIMYFRREDNLCHEIQRTFGSTFSSRYGIKVLPNVTKGESPFVPDKHWAYREYNRLSAAGLVSPIPGIYMGYGGLLTRWEFAYALARVKDNDLNNPNNPNETPEMKGAIAKLEQEFASELSEFGIHVDIRKAAIYGTIYQPRYRYLSFNFSYGKGFNKKLRKKVEQIIADYSAAWLKSNSSANTDSAKSKSTFTPAKFCGNSATKL